MPLREVAPVAFGRAALGDRLRRVGGVGATSRRDLAGGDALRRLGVEPQRDRRRPAHLAQAQDLDLARDLALRSLAQADAVADAQFARASRAGC